MILWLFLVVLVPIVLFGLVMWFGVRRHYRLMKTNLYVTVNGWEHIRIWYRGWFGICGYLCDSCNQAWPCEKVRYYQFVKGDGS